jgi:type II secretory pathway pseudopilin PulG
MKTQSYTKRSQADGFTLVEVVVASFLVGMTLASLFSLLNWVSYAVSLSGQTTQATELAQEKMEELLNSDYDTIISGSDKTWIFQRDWNVSSGSSSNCKDIVVAIGWKDFRGREQEIRNQSVAVSTKLNTDGMSFADFPMY